MSNEHIAEMDWRLLRDLKPTLLNRHCERILEEVTLVSNDASKSPHNRYLEIYKLIEDRDRQIADAFNDFRRSVAIFRIAYLHRLKLLTAEEFAQFSAETQHQVQAIVRR